MKTTNEKIRMNVGVFISVPLTIIIYQYIRKRELK